MLVLAWVSVFVSLCGLMLAGFVSAMSWASGHDNSGGYLLFVFLSASVAVFAFCAHYGQKKKRRLLFAITNAIEQDNPVQLQAALMSYHSKHFFEPTMLIRFRFQAEELNHASCVNVLTHFIHRIGL